MNGSLRKQTVSYEDSKSYYSLLIDLMVGTISADLNLT